MLYYYVLIYLLMSSINLNVVNVLIYDTDINQYQLISIYVVVELTHCGLCTVMCY